MILQNIKKTKIYQIVLGLIIGIILAQIEIGLIFIVVIIILIFYFKLTSYTLLLLFVILGFLYTHSYAQALENETNTLNKFHENIKVEVIEEPLGKEFNQEALLKAKDSSIFILGKFNKYEDLNLGDDLFIKGEFELPKESKFFDKIAYLRSKRVFLEVNNPQILKIQRELDFEKFTSSTKNILSKYLVSNFTEPQTTLAKGLIIGDDSNFDDEFKEKLKVSGLSHITSVSGYNVAIIFAGILYLTRFINRKLCLLIGIILIYFFWQIVGSYNLPTERATIMLSIASIGLLLGRRINIYFLVGISTLLMLLEYPFYLQNVSFQLSLGAVLGILILAPKLITSLEKLKVKNLLTEIIAVTISVLIFTTPISFITFSQTSSIAIISNTLVLPLIPILTILIIAGIGLSILNLSPLYEAVYLITNYLLKIVINIIEALGSISFASIHDPFVAILFFTLLLIPTIYLLRLNKNEQ